MKAIVLRLVKETGAANATRCGGAVLMRWCPLLLVLLSIAPGCARKTSATFAAVDTKGDGTDAQGLHVSDRLSNEDPTAEAKPGCHFKRFEFKMTSGTYYIIDLMSKDFDAFLRLEDANGKLLAEDDDSGGNQNARIIFRAPQADTYRIVATTFRPNQTGQFTLSVLPPGVIPAGQQGERGGFSDIAVHVDAGNIADLGLGNQDDTHGYVEYRLTVVNHSPTDSHRVTVMIPKRTTGPEMGGGHYLRSIACSMPIEPSSQAPVSLFQPNLRLTYSTAPVGVEVDGRSAPVEVPLALQRDRGDRMLWRPSQDRSSLTRSILTSAGMSAILQQHVVLSAVDQPPPPAADRNRFGTMGGTFRGKSYNYVPLNRFRNALGSVDSWSRHWLGYSSYDGIVMRDADFNAAPPEVQSALWQYVECGGSLLIVGSDRAPHAWQRTRQTIDKMIAYYPGFGQCLVVPEKDIAKWQPEEWRALVAMWEQSARAWRAVQTADAANQRFPVVDNVRIPVRDLFLVMLVFAILIGPVNILVLSWSKRRIWLLWTVPTFSLLTCAAVVAFMSLTEDWEGYVRSEGFTVLDESAERAASVGWLGLYTPHTPGDGLHFNRDVELTPHVLQTSNYRSGQPRTIDWTNDQHLKSGWLSARLPAHFLVRSSEARSEHLVVDHQPDGSTAIVNALGARITALWLADNDGKTYTATDVPPDGRTTLTPVTGKAAGAPTRLRQLFAGDWLNVMAELTADPQAYLQPGHYVALLDAAPFLPQGLDAATSRHSRSVVLGIMKTR